MRSLLATILRIDQSDLLKLNGVKYSVLERNDVGIVLAHEEIKGRTETFTHSEIWNRFQNGSLTIERGYFDLTQAKLRLHAGSTDLDGLTPKEKSYCLHAARCCDEFLRLHQSDPKTYPRTRAGFKAAAKTIGEVLLAEAAAAPIVIQRNPKAAPLPDAGKTTRPRAGDVIVALRPPSGRTLERWLKTYLLFDCHPVALRTRYFRCGRSESPLQAEVQAMLTSAAAGYLDERRPSISMVHRDLTAQIFAENKKRTEDAVKLVVPSIKTLRKAIKNNFTRFEVHAARYGIQAARRKFAIVTLGIDIKYPGQRVEIDESKMPVVSKLKAAGIWETLTAQQQQSLIKLGRLWIVSAIDVRTTVVLGYVLTRNPSSDAVLAVLSLMTRDKTAIVRAAGAQGPADMACGADAIATDAGGPEISDAARSAIVGMGCKHLIGPVGSPSGRGTQERFFGTVNSMLIATYTGGTFANPVQRGDYDSIDRRSMEGELLALDVCRHLVDIHHLTPSAALNGETPLDCWRRLASTVGVVPAPSPNKRRVLFGLRVLRKPGTRGIRVLGNDYQGTGLQEFLRGTAPVPPEGLEVAIDQHDLGAVSVRIGRDWFELPAVDATLSGVPLAVLVEAMAEMRRRYGEAAKLHAHTIHEARLAIIERSGAAIALAALGPTRPSAASIERAERSLSITLVEHEYWRSVPEPETPNDLDATPVRFSTGNAQFDPQHGVNSDDASDPASGSSAIPPSDDEPTSYWSIEE